jgi:UDP-glucose 4-epimerase
MVRIFVTGGAGYIGSHTVNALRDCGFEVLVFDNLSTGTKDSLADAVPIVKGDVENLQELTVAMKKFQPDAVIHFAGLIDVAESFEQPETYIETNTIGTLNVLKAMVIAGCRHLVFSSTAAVYGNTSTHRITEQDPIEPINPYGHSKAMAERLIQLYALKGSLRYSILRYFNVAGASSDGRNGQRSHKAHQLIHIVTEKVLGLRQNLEVFGSDYSTDDGTCIRDFIHVDDLAEAHISALNYLASGRSSEIFNVGYGTGYSVLSVIKTMEKTAGVRIDYNIVNRRPGDPAKVIADAEKLKQLTKWAPRFNNLEIICRSSLEWLRKFRMSEIT